MPSTAFSDDQTYVGSSRDGPSYTGPANDKGKNPAVPLSKSSLLIDGPSLTASNGRKPFFHSIDEATGGLMGAIERLDDELQQAGRDRIISHKGPSRWAGKLVEPGRAGLYVNGASPKIILKPGRYPGAMLRNWFARQWAANPLVQLSDPVIDFGGFVAVQVSMNQAAIVADPSNRVFCVKNGGFAAISLSGSYRVLGVVDQVNLAEQVVDPYSAQKRVLGHYETIQMPATPALGGKSFVAATFVDIPANNVVVLQRGDDLEQLKAGQHVILNPNVTIRGWFTTAESQLEMTTPDICYKSPYDALRDKTLSVLTQVVSHLDYSSLVRQRGFQPGDAVEAIDDSSTAFLDALRTRAMDELHESAAEYGLQLQDLAVLDREFRGETARTLDSLTIRALQAQVEVANVAAKQRKTEADANAYAITARAKAEAEAVEIAASARARAVRLEAEADAAVKDDQARRMQLARAEVNRVSAYGNKAVFVPDSGFGSAVLGGYAISAGGQQAAMAAAAAKLGAVQA
ncbi:uncharacterized protein JCM10292_007476 [Rhodotorula paludigena]|uniref:uncharacterized protein n=1 Tax=Rhodotorula paludigena TaxID=86838 RepID=UPI00317D49CC